MKILIIQTAYLGDVILTTPLIAQIKIAYPNSKISMLVIPQTADILNGHKLLDEIIIYDKRRFLSIFTQSIGLIEKIYKRFNMVISPHLSARSTSIAFLSGAKIRVGFKNSALPFLYTNLAEYKGSHIIEKHSNLIKSLGFDITKQKISLSATDDDIKKAKKLLKIRDDNKKQLAGIFPFSEWITKTPPISLLISAIKIAIKKKPFIPIFLDAKRNENINKIVEEELNGVNLMGKTDLMTLKGVVSQLDIVITGDSAGAHISSAFSKPTIVIYGATRPIQGFHPWMTDYRAIMADVPCSPCSPHGSTKCPLGHLKCMKDIRAEDLADSILELLCS
ncbi:MAG: glycosyltransferase family 9 protein [bacterium]